MIEYNKNQQAPSSAIIACGFLLLLFCYHLIFKSFFPNYYDGLGHDYSLLFPSLLDGYFWFRNNSLLDVPWFSPSFCGGQPNFADVQSGYYSVVQALAFFFNPLTSTYASVVLFAAIGFWGMYLLLRKVFKVSEESAFLAASLFMFNGFYSHRMIVGHFGYHGFMLVPWAALLLLHSIPNDRKGMQSINVFSAVWVGLIIAYWIQSGLGSLMIPVALAVLAIVCLADFGNWKDFFYRSAGAIVIASALCASKLVAGAAFMANFNRSHYLLPGIKGVPDAISLILTTLFFPLKEIEQFAIPKMTNMQWMLSRHEWEFSVTFIPLLIIVVCWATRLRTGIGPRQDNNKKTNFSLILLLIVLAIPLVLNIYTPEWNATLKSIPLIKSSSGLIRWWIIYIPIVIIYAAMELDRLHFLSNHRSTVVAGCVLLIVGLNLTQDRLYYDMQHYDPKTISEAYAALGKSDAKPAIHSIGTATPAAQGNDTLVSGVSQLTCYNPSFGYRLESLPLKTLHPGSILDQTDGYLNLKNPACYLYPAENNCQPGDHFKVTQTTEAQLFAQYKPFPFEISGKQKIANWVTKISLLFVLVWLAYYLVTCIRQRPRPSS